MLHSTLLRLGKNSQDYSSAADGCPYLYVTYYMLIAGSLKLLDWTHQMFLLRT
jgi:hypothetical protein